MAITGSTIHTTKQQRADFAGRKKEIISGSRNVTEEERNGTDMKGTEKES